MKNMIIDSHIHFDLYEENEQQIILRDLSKYHIKALISVSNHLKSAQKNLQLARKNSQVKPAFGYHPEQSLPSDQEVSDLLLFIDKYTNEMIAIGEVGLPHYLRRNDSSIKIEPYIELLEVFIKKAALLDKPIIVHAVYEDAPIVCDLLEKHSIKRAHFHWFKGDQHTIERMIENGYYISVTPDVLYERKIQNLIKHYPLSNLMVETDGPWKFEGPFTKMMTHPKMIHESIKQIAHIKKLNKSKVYETLYKNTIEFYSLG